MKQRQKKFWNLIVVSELHFQCNVLWKHPKSQYLCYLHPSELRPYTIYTYALPTSTGHVWRKASTSDVLSEPSRGLHVYCPVPRHGWGVPPAALVGCRMLEPRSTVSSACPHSVLTQENFPLRRQGHRGRKAAGEGWDQHSERCYRCRKESLAVCFCLQLLTKKPYDKRNKPATFLSNLLQEPLSSLSPLFIVFLRVSFFFPPNYNFCALTGQERIQFKRKNSEAISVPTGMDNQKAIRFNSGTHTGLLICPKGATKPEEKGEKGL